MSQPCALGRENPVSRPCALGRETPPPSWAAVTQAQEKVSSALPASWTRSRGLGLAAVEDALSWWPSMRRC